LSPGRIGLTVRAPPERRVGWSANLESGTRFLGQNRAQSIEFPRDPIAGAAPFRQIGCQSPRQVGISMQDQEQAELRVKIARLEIEHEDIGHAIDALIAAGSETLRIQRFKKKKLALKDEIVRLRARLIPDIIA
jgi:hypothetical protein